MVRELEARLERPVVTSNQAVIWDALRLVDWQDRCDCQGRLFATNSTDALAHVAKTG
jgi:maleate cis-trans isomerase